MSIAAAAHNSDFFAAAKTGEALKAGPIGLAVILLLCIASYFLFKSMSKHMRNVRENFPADAFPPPTGPVRPQASDFRPGGPRALDSSAGPGNGSVNMARAVPVDRDQPGEAPPPAEPGA